MTIRVCVAGVTGWTGKAVAQGICIAGDMTLVSAVSRSSAGKSLGDLGLEFETNNDVVVVANVEEALARC